MTFPFPSVVRLESLLELSEEEEEEEERTHRWCVSAIQHQFDYLRILCFGYCEPVSAHSW